MTLRLISLLGVLVLVVAACHNEDERTTQLPPSVSRDEVVLAPDSPKLAYIKIRTVELSRRPLMEPVAGKLSYDETRTVRVTSPIAGRVLNLKAEIGQRLASNAALLELDSPELGQAQADHAAAVADLRLAGRAFDRVKDLFDHGVSPRKDYEQARDTLDRTRIEAERSRLKLANLGIGAERSDERFTLHTPIEGVVTERHANPGMEVRPDLPEPLFVVSDLRRLWVLLDVFEKDLGKIHVDQDVQIMVPAYPDRGFSAKIATIGKTIDESTRTVKVRAVIDNPDGALLPAMYATVEVESDPGDRSVVLPLEALYTEGESDWVFVAAGEGRFHKRQVQVGLRLRDRAVIESGLKAGEPVAVTGALLLRSELDTAQQTGAGGS